LIVKLAPLLGPVIGGGLAENIDWSWCFFVNLPVGITLMVLLYAGLPKSQPDWHEFVNADWIGILGLSAGLSSLTVVLEEGQRENWFDSPMISWLTVLAVVGVAGLIAGQFLTKRPVVKLKLLSNGTYGGIIFIVFVLGAGFYCIAYLLPQFLAGIAGYNAEQSGSIMLVSGLPAFLMMPILPRLLGKVDFRFLLVAGLLCFGISCLLDIALTAQSVGHDFYGSQLLRGAGQMLAMMPLNQAAMTSVSREETAEAAGLYNMARNLGGSVGLALLGVYIDRRNAFHDAFIRESVTANSTIGQDHIANSAGGFLSMSGDMAHSTQQAFAQLAGTIQQQAAVMTYSETFFVMAIAMILCVPLALFLRKTTPPTAGPGPGAAAGGH
jgi:DHA2 family multidrug resistance protein